MKRRSHGALWLTMAGLTVCFGGCDDGSASDDKSDAFVATHDATPLDDLGLQDGALASDALPQPDAAPRATELGPTVEVRPPTRLELDWLVAAVGANDPDPVIDSLLTGTFEPPPGPGWHGGQLSWRENPYTEEGTIEGTPRSGSEYAIATIPADTGALLVQADRALGVYQEGVAQPGDAYGSGRLRIPMPDTGTERTLVARVYGARGAPRLQVFSTPDEVYFNFADATFPTLRVGDDRPRPLGVPILNLTTKAAWGVRAVVVESEHFEASSIDWPALPATAATQIGFELVPKAPFADAGAVIPVRLRIESLDFENVYEATYELTVAGAEVPWRETFRSPVDASVQYYGVQAPPGWDGDGDAFAGVLSLHGAGVEAIGQARSYSKHEETFIFAPTNRRPFGFDWEEWGRLNGLAALDDGMAKFGIDPTRVYLTGHSMGGHGTWHLGVTTPGRFATLGPSAGWSSFQTYTGRAAPRGAFARARAHSTTNQYVSNLANRGIYVIHGSADDNVPVREGRDMVALVSEITDDVEYHEEPGAGHWWDGEVSPGADCVDWPPLFAFMSERRLNPWETDFTFKTPAPSYSASHSFVTLHSSVTPFEDVTVRSVRDNDAVTITTTNARSLAVDGAALAAIGITTVIVDGENRAVEAASMVFGPEGGKRPGQQGPYNQVYRKPFCFIYAEDRPFWARYAQFLVSDWSFIGNGHACALPWRLRHQAEGRQKIYIGVPWAQLGTPADGLAYGAQGVSVGDSTHEGAAALVTYPEGDGVAAALWAAEGSEALLYSVVPFSSGAGMPDYLVWSREGALAAGFFDADWQYDPNLREP